MILIRTDFIEVYDDTITLLNSYQGAPFQQALSGLTNINNNWYNAKDYATYSFYYSPGAQGQITWSVGDVPAWKLDARAIGPNGNVGQRVIPMEPMAVVMNFGMSTGFSAINLTGIESTLPATMRFDYVRIYQDESKKSMTCDPEGYETTSYIANHKEAYTNPNKTQWYVEHLVYPYTTLIKLPGIKRRTHGLKTRSSTIANKHAHSLLCSPYDIPMSTPVVPQAKITRFRLPFA